MNVIVSNKQKQIIDNANIDAIKDLNGLFNVDDLISKFRNYFFNKMILDATSIVNFTSNKVLGKLAREIGSERLYILLPETPEPPQSFINKLIELHIYNFSTNINDIVKFLAVPNTYENIVGNNLENNNLYVDNSVKEESTQNVDNNYSSNNENFNDNIQFVNDNNDFASNVSYSDNINNVNNVNINYQAANTTEFNHYDMNDVSLNSNREVKKRVIGFKNVTTNAGSTTMCYLLYRLLKKKNINVVVFEINKNDFRYYQDNNMFSFDEKSIMMALQRNNSDIVLVDLNNCKDTSFCTDIFYLIEPSVIKLNKLMTDDKYAFRALYNKQLILNKSLLSSREIEMLSKEAGVKFFYNVPPLNDRVDNDVISDLLHKIGVN